MAVAGDHDEPALGQHAQARVEVEDDGSGNAGVPRAPGGGLTGMAERVGAFGGELTCGPRQPRGWRVTARLDPGPAASP